MFIGKYGSFNPLQGGWVGGGILADFIGKKKRIRGKRKTDK
jgi:hypothetical protein